MWSSLYTSNAAIRSAKYASPPTSRMYLVEKFVCSPEPFQSSSEPSGLQCQLTSTPYRSQSRMSRYRATHSSSAARFEPLPKIWNSH